MEVRVGRAVIRATWRRGAEQEAVRSKLAFWFSLAAVTNVSAAHGPVDGDTWIRASAPEVDRDLPGAGNWPPAGRPRGS